MALGVLHALHERGRRVPGDVSVVGFDDVPEAEFFWPALTTVSQAFSTLGERAVELTLRALAGEDRPAAELVQPELVVRASTARRRAGLTPADVSVHTVSATSSGMTDDGRAGAPRSSWAPRPARSLEVLTLGATVHRLEVTGGDGVRRNIVLGHATRRRLPRRRPTTSAARSGATPTGSPVAGSSSSGRRGRGRDPRPRQPPARWTRRVRPSPLGGRRPRTGPRRAPAREPRRRPGVPRGAGRARAVRGDRRPASAIALRGDRRRGHRRQPDQPRLLQPRRRRGGHRRRPRADRARDRSTRRSTAPASRSATTHPSPARRSTSGPRPRSVRPSGTTTSRSRGRAASTTTSSLDGAGWRPAAVLESRRTATRLTVQTDQPGLQVYTGNFLDGSRPLQPAAALYRQGDGIALEPQLFPDSPEPARVAVSAAGARARPTGPRWPGSSAPVPGTR